MQTTARAVQDRNRLNVRLAYDTLPWAVRALLLFIFIYAPPLLAESRYTCTDICQQTNIPLILS
jgi:hypothetical protein